MWHGGGVHYLTRAQQTVLACILLLLLTGGAVKAWRAAARPAPAPLPPPPSAAF
jgi:hypothetical protein